MKRREDTEKRNPRALDAHGPDPIGLDIGTTHIVVYQNGNAAATTRMETNVFFTVPSKPQTKEFLL